jgi:hypothetical protein
MEKSLKVEYLHSNKIAATYNKIWFERMLIENVYTQITNHKATCVDIST